MKKVIQDFTEGPLFKPMLTFSVPFMVSNALLVLYSMVDMLIVGHYVGRDGISAVTIASAAVMFLTMVGKGFATSSQVMVSQLIGRGKRNKQTETTEGQNETAQSNDDANRKKLNATIGTSFAMNGIMGIGMALLVACFADEFLQLLDTPKEAYDGAYSYLLVCGIGSVFIYGYNMVCAVLRGVGDSVRPFWFIVISSITNVFLDLLFVACFKWGVAGAGVATIISQAVACMLSVGYLYRNRIAFCFDFKLSSFKIDMKILPVLLKLGAPFAARFGAIQLSMLFVNGMINTQGVAASAGYGIGARLDEFANKISQGVMMAVSTITGQNMGAARFDRIRKAVRYAWLICGGFFLVFGIFLMLFPTYFFGIFTSDPEVLALAPGVLGAMIIHYPALLIMKGTNGFVQGIGNATFGLIIAMLDGFVFRLLFSWLFGSFLNYGLYGYIFGYALATYSTALPSLFYFLFIPWHKRRTVL